MGFEILGRPPKAQEEVNFYTSDWHGLLNVNDMPQIVDDNDLTICQNFYGSTRGGVYMRKGIKARGSVLEANSVMKGLFRFEQLTIDGVTQNPSVATLMGMVGSSLTAGGDLWDVDGNAQKGGSNVLGATAQPWSAEQIYDPDHTLPTPAAPSVVAQAGGSLAAGTYLISVTWTNAAGETLRGPDLTKSGVTLNQELVVTQPTPPIGATGWNIYVSTVNGARATETVQNGGSPVAIGTTTFTVTSIAAGASPPGASTATAASDVMVICTGSGGPYVWDGTNVYVPAAWSSNCPNARWCEVVNNILWFGGLGQSNLVVGMALGHPETLSTGGQNTFAVSHPVTGLGTLGAGTNAGLVIGQTQGVSTLYGTGLQSFYMQETTSDDGVAAGGTMITYSGYIYWLGRDNIYIFDGNAIEPIGTKVRPYILNDALYSNPWDIPMNGTRSISWAMYYNHRLYFWYDSGPVGYPNVALVWDLDLQGWTTYTGPGLNCAALLNASSDGSPLACVVGGATSAQNYNFDVYNGTSHNVDDAGTAINAQFQTKYFKMGYPDTDKKLLRVYPELFSEPLNAQILASPDYGGPVVQGTAVAGVSSATWDTSKWDQASWGSGYLTYSENRADFAIFYHAMALGMISTVVQAPFYCQAFGGRYTQNPMNG